MADETKKAWQEVADNFSALGRHVSSRYRADAGGKESEADKQEREKLGNAVRSVIDQLNDVFTSLGDSLREPEGKAALSSSVRSVGRALTVTFQEAGEEIGRTFSGKGTRADDQTPPPPAPPPDEDDPKTS